MEECCRRKRLERKKERNLEREDMNRKMWLIRESN
jgi:hypothetical protein